MALDLSRFAKAFFEEAQEHLYSLESLLIAVNIHAPDDETLNAIFRAVHSVKGGAAAFGFTSLIGFTHEFESILDRVRKRQLTLSKRLVDLCLSASDIMRRHLAVLEQNQAPDLAELAAMQTALLDTANSAPQTPTQSATQTSSSAGSIAGASTKSSTTQITGGDKANTLEIGNTEPAFHVAMRLPINDYPHEAAIEELLADIHGLGRCVSHESESVDQSQLELRFVLVADIDADELRESLEFLAPADSIFIQPTMVAAPGAGSASLSAPPESEADESAYEFFAPLDESDEATSSEMSPNLALGGPFQPVAGGSINADSPASEQSDIALASLVDASSIRVNVAKVDQLINLVGELVIAEAMLTEAASVLAETDKTHLSYALSQLQRNTRELQESVLAIRMLPISFVFSRLPRLTRDLADRLGKEVFLEIHGEDTELDKSVIEKIADPLTHLVRNALDHGIESPEERMRNGKPRAGCLSVRAGHQGGGILLSVADDGAGLNRDRIVAKANELGLQVTDKWSDDEIWPLIFTPGFSTAESVSDVSGRGVGMDVVWQNVHALGGNVDVASRQGEGTIITIRLPLTLAILDGMSIKVSGETYILPLAHISQSLQPTMDAIKTVNKQEVVQLRDEYIPITSLKDLFNLADAPAENNHRGINGQTDAIGKADNLLVVLDIDGKRAALRVDELLGQHQVVLKSIEANYRRVKGLSGATIMGDGRVAFILDAAYLVGVAHTVDTDLAAAQYG